MRGLLVAVMLAGCGDNQNICDYREHDDTSPFEATGLVLGTRAKNICGQIDGGHFDSMAQVVDRDAYRVTVGGDGELLVQVTGEADLSVFDAFDIRIFDTADNPTLLAQAELAPAVADHTAFVARVPPGDVDVVVAARGKDDIVGSATYRLRLSTEPGHACPTSTSGAGYVEAHDGAAETGNDVALVDFSRMQPFTADPASHPEPTGITVQAGIPDVIDGLAGMGARGDNYLDRDTYAFATDDTTNELAIRVDWPDSVVDLDAILFDPATLAPILLATRTSITVREFAVVAVRPRTTYWLWIGRFSQPPSTGTESYSVTICGNYFY